MIVPSDSTHDYTPVDPPLIDVGQEVLFQAEARGEVTFANDSGGGIWVYLIDEAAFATINESDPSWGTIYKRQAKPPRGTKFTASDGSRWVYPAQPHGLYRCWQAGTVHGEGLRHRAEIEGLVAD